MSFPVENVPDSDSVFMRAHQNYMVNGQLRPGVFTAHDGAMSVDWNKYSEPKQTLDRARNPKQNAVIEMNVGRIRAVPQLDVLHTPEIENRAHCDVPLPESGEDLTEARFNLKKIATMVIPLSA